MRKKIFQYEKTITDFVQKQRGCFIVLSHDQTFLAVLRTVLTKDLALVAADMILSVQETGKLTKVIKQAEGLYMYPFLFIERSIKGQDTAPVIRQLREAFPKLFIVVLTIDVEKYRIMYLHELGVDNFITKPVSASTIIEKIAFTIKPQNKHGELIDQAKKHQEAGEIDKAKALSVKILGIKPGSAAGLMVLGDAEAAAGNMDAAREAYLEASQNADLYLEPLRKLAELAERTGDLVWPLPMWDDYDANLKSSVADVANIGPREGGAINAALFLRRFIEKGVRWAHLDIAGPGYVVKPSPLLPIPGGTGTGLRLICRLLENKEALTGKGGE